MRTYDGVLSCRWENGDETAAWILMTDAPVDGHVLPEAGDRLTVWNHDGGFAFDDIIEPDYRARWAPSPHAIRRPESWQRFSPLHWLRYLVACWCSENWGRLPGLFRRALRNRLTGSSGSLGFWIPWTQRGWDAARWASLFVVEGAQAPYRARIARPGRKEEGH